MIIFITSKKKYSDFLFRFSHFVKEEKHLMDNEVYNDTTTELLIRKVE